MVSAELTTFGGFIFAMFPVYLLLFRMNQTLGSVTSQVETNSGEIERLRSKVYSHDS